MRLRSGLIIVPSALLVVSISITIIFTSGFISRYPNDLAILQKQIKRGGSERAKAAKCMIEKNCIKQETTHKVLVLGDSYSKGTAIALNEAYPELDITLIHLGGCKPLKGDDSSKWLTDIGGNKSKCAEFVEKVFNSDLSKYDTIVFALRWANRHFKYVNETVDFLSTKTDRIIVFGQRLVMREKASELLSKSNSLKQFAENSNAAVFRKQYNWGNTNLRQILNTKPATYIDVGKLQGGISFNNLTSKGDIYIYDDGHLTLNGAKDIGWKVKQLYPELFNATSN